VFEYRLYIDESGDHSYKHVSQLDKRYLGLTGILVNKKAYDTMFQPQLEQLKRFFFRYDIDEPIILVRKEIVQRRGAFSVLRDPDLNSKWDESILNYFAGLIPYSQVFTVVMDKKTHLEKYPQKTFEAYGYALKVLLRRVRGYLSYHDRQSDVMIESRGKKEDRKLEEAYHMLHVVGDGRYGTANDYQQSFPAEDLIVRKKEENIAGLQIADLLVHGQTLATIIKARKPAPVQLGPFAKRLNSAIDPMINPFGQYLLA
jgi:hypothetical protein